MHQSGERSLQNPGEVKSSASFRLYTSVDLRFVDNIAKSGRDIGVSFTE